jgi:hypothetical protein
LLHIGQSGLRLAPVVYEEMHSFQGTAALGGHPGRVGQRVEEQAGGTVLYLALVALLSYGVAAVLRDTAGAIATMLILLYIAPILTQLVTDPRWLKRIDRVSPMLAGLKIQATTALDSLTIGPWQGLGVLALWAAGALLAGLLSLQLRDAGLRASWPVATTATRSRSGTAPTSACGAAAGK